MEVVPFFCSFPVLVLKCCHATAQTELSLHVSTRHRLTCSRLASKDNPSNWAWHPIRHRRPERCLLWTARHCNPPVPPQSHQLVSERRCTAHTAPLRTPTSSAGSPASALPASTHTHALCLVRHQSHFVHSYSALVQMHNRTAQK